MMNDLATGDCKKTGFGILIMAVFLLFGVMSASAQQQLSKGAQGALKMFPNINEPFVRTFKDSSKRSLLPLQWMVLATDKLGPAPIPDMIEAGADVNLLGPDGSSALHMIVELNKPEPIIKLLVAAGADINIKNTKEKRTPLHEASKYGKIKAMKALLDAGADPNIQDVNGITALNIKGIPIIDDAMHIDRFETAKVLVDAGANPNLSDKEGNTPLINAASRGDARAINLLIDADADPGKADKKLGDTPLHYILSRAMQGKIDFSLVKTLINHGDSLKVRNAEGETPWSGSAFYANWLDASDIPLIRYLLEHGIDPNVVNARGRTFLQEASDSEHSDALAPLVESFINAGADLNTKSADAFAYSALHLAVNRACKHGEMQITKTLLKLGANPDIKNSLGETALRWGNCNDQVKQLFSSHKNNKKVTASALPKKPTQKQSTDTKKEKLNESLNKAIKAYVAHVDKKGRAYQQAKQKTAKARGFSGLTTRQAVQSRQQLFADFKDKTITLIVLLKDAKKLAWNTVQENKIEATKKEVEAAIVRKFGKRITADGLQPLQAQFYWADAYYNVFTMLDQRWGAWSVDAGKHTLNASDKSLQAKLNKEMKAIADLESYLNQQSK